MKWIGNLRKLTTDQAPDSKGEVGYHLVGVNVIRKLDSVKLNEWVGQHVTVEFLDEIHCRKTGQKIKKTFGEGLSYSAWLEDPGSVESVLRPELSRIHEGVALRDYDWEQKHHNQPHFVYLSQTGGFKVGVTRTTNAPYRWHDQGAVGALVIAKVPYRQLAGEIEVALKSIVSDKTNYRKMLTDVTFDSEGLMDLQEACYDELGSAYESFFVDESAVTRFHYPVKQYPEKIQSRTLDKQSKIEGLLVGIKGQYLLFESGEVINVRRHSGYRVSIHIS
jgi:hypothetical protein